MIVEFDVSKWQYDEMTAAALHYGFDSVDDWMLNVFTRMFSDSTVLRKLLAANRAATVLNSLVPKKEETLPDNVFPLADEIIKRSKGDEPDPTGSKK